MTSLHNIPNHRADLEVDQLCLKKCPLKDRSEGCLCSTCFVIMQAYRRYQDANIPIAYWQLSMSRHFVGYPPLLARYEAIVSDLKAHYLAGKTVCVAGPHGTGKTLFATSILKKTCDKGFTALYTQFSDVVNSLLYAPDKLEVKDDLITSSFLVIDEMDPRFYPSQSASELFGRTLENVFRCRLQNSLPTILITNSPNPAASFTGAMKDSLSSLFSTMEVLPIVGEDFRKTRLSPS